MEQSDNTAVNHSSHNKWLGKVWLLCSYIKYSFPLKGLLQNLKARQHVLYTHWYFYPLVIYSPSCTCVAHGTVVMSCPLCFLQVLLEGRSPGCKWNSDGKLTERVYSERGHSWATCTQQARCDKGQNCRMKCHCCCSWWKRKPPGSSKSRITWSEVLFLT